jgi:hypothetical protein
VHHASLLVIAAALPLDEGEILVRIGPRGAGRAWRSHGVPAGRSSRIPCACGQGAAALPSDAGEQRPFYWSASEPATTDSELPVDFARVQASAKQYGAVEILGPPLIDAMTAA